LNTLIKNLSKPRATVIPLVAAAVITLSACVADDDPNRRAKLGVGIGAVGGAVIAKVTGSDNVLLGATLGALAGGAVGHYQDRQQAALKVALEKELRNKQVDVQRLDNDVLLVRLNSQASFDSGSAEVKPAFHSTLDKIATETSTFDKTILHVVGYTDSDGTDEFNQRLSVKRADSVADYLNGDATAVLKFTSSPLLKVKSRKRLKDPLLVAGLVNVPYKRRGRCRYVAASRLVKTKQGPSRS